MSTRVLPLSPEELLFSQGFGTRRVCAGLFQQGFVQFSQTEPAGTAPENIAIQNPLIHAYDGMVYQVQGQAWEYHEKAYLMLHKPAGYECSHRPGAWPSVYSLLPAPLRQRPTKTVVQGVQAVGRLDQDTTGLLLLTDDGQFLHRMSSPKHHVPKIYQVSTDRKITTAQILQLLRGVLLKDERGNMREEVRAAAAEPTGERSLALTLLEGKYHQVKRMIAAVGNHVTALHRSQIGSITLPEDLALGKWRWLSSSELTSLIASKG